MEAICDWEGAKWLLFGPNVPPLILYTHLTNIVVLLGLAFFVLINNPKSLANRVFFLTILPIVGWIFFSQIFWATNRGDMVMFAWSMDILFEPLAYIGSLYLMYVLLKGRDLPFKYKLIFSILFLPVALLLPTNYILSSFDVSTCLAEETYFSYYTYLLEIVATLSIVILSLRQYQGARDKNEKKKILLLTVGILLFLLAFAWGNIVGSFSDDWVLADYGLLGLPVFMAFLVYSIVQFRLFNIKVIGASALVVVLWAGVGSLLFINNVEIARTVVAIVSMIVFVAGISLIKAVRKEVLQRELIEKQEKELETANARLRELDELKTEFVSLATHQIRAPLTSIKGYVSLIEEGDYGPVSPEVKGALGVVYESTNNLVTIVGDFLDVSRIEQGRMKYDYSDFDVSQLVNEVVTEYKPNIDKRGLQISCEIEPNHAYTIRADKGKVKQVIGNILDNSIKYTPKGNIWVSLVQKGNKNLIKIADTGVGIKKETMPKLFQKFSRADDAGKTNILGTGLGLYVAKNMIESMGGRIWAESEGEGKGSQFYIELPAQKA